MNHTIIGTAGHVDHGKTLLVKALTGMDTDRLKEEKRRGITIDLGFAWLTLPDGERVGIVDVPGHERFVRNMLAGAGGVNLALMVIAADDGVMPQTREHLDILTLLGIEDGIIVITKADLVEEEWIDLLKEEIAKEVAHSFLRDAPIVAVSAVTGQGIDALRALIVEKARAAANRNLSRPFRIPLDRVFSVEGFGTVATGTLIEGSLAEGGEVEVYPSGLRCKVRKVQVHGETVGAAWAGQRVAVNLAGVKRGEVRRGDTLAAAGSMRNVRMIDAKVRALAGSKRTLLNGSRLHFCHGARNVLCKLVLLNCDALEAGQEAYAQLRFTQDIAVKKGDRFVLRFYSPIETVGGGVVLDPSPPKHRRNDERVWEALSIRETGSPSETLLQVITDASPKYPQAAEIQKQLAMDSKTFSDTLESLIAEGSVIRLSARTIVAAAFKDALGVALTQIVRDYHAANPLQAGIRRDELRGRLTPGLEISLADRMLALFEQEGLITASGGKIALRGFTVEYSESDKRLLEQIQARMGAAEFTPPSIDEFYELYPKEKAALKRVFDALLDTGSLAMVAPQMVFLAETVEKAWEMVEAFIRQNGQITVAQFRDMIGASRKYALPMLEYFDRQGRTRLVNDARVLDKKRGG